MLFLLVCSSLLFFLIAFSQSALIEFPLLLEKEIYLYRNLQNSTIKTEMRAAEATCKSTLRRVNSLIYCCFFALAAWPR